MGLEAVAHAIGVEGEISQQQHVRETCTCLQQPEFGPDLAQLGLLLGQAADQIRHLQEGHEHLLTGDYSAAGANLARKNLFREHDHLPEFHL
jgi:hypothetical protein